MSDPLTLPERLDLSAAMQLASDLRGLEGDVVIDASQVKHLGALCLQALVASSRKTTAGGNKFEMTGVSDKILEQLQCMGASPEQLMEGAL